MREIFVSLGAVSLVIVVFGSALVHSSKASVWRENDDGMVLQGVPGSRCTRLLYGPREKKSKAKKSTASSPVALGGPGSRCLRLFSGPRKGKYLPNTPPKVGLSASTSYLGADAGSEVKLKAIACDSDDDNVLYTYSASAGRIQGEGPDAVWNLSGVSRPGQYIVTVEVDDGCGCVSSADAQVTVGG